MTDIITDCIRRVTAVKNERELIRHAFEKSALFCGASSDVLMLGDWFVREFKRSLEIFEEQNGVECVGVIIKGCAQVIPGDQSAVSVLTTGGEFGICNIFVHKKMPTQIVAKTGCAVAFIPKDVFAKMLASDSALMYRYVRLCNQKMLYLADRLALMSISGCEKRLAYWLYRNALSDDGGAAGGVPISKDGLAKQLSMSRASLFRAVSALEKKGIIKPTGGKIVVCDPDAEIFDFAKSKGGRS